jgi:YggT family protein
MPLVVLLVDRAINLLMLLIVITSLLSWVQPDPRNPVVRFLHGVVDPVLHPIRAILPNLGGFDLSPLVAILILSFLQRLLTSNLL